MDKLYEDAAKFGIVTSNIYAIIGTVVGVLMIIGGIYIVLTKVYRTAQVDGSIKNCTCNVQRTSTKNGYSTSYNCNFDVYYSINSVENNKHFNTNSSVTYADNQKITLYYDPNDITNIEINRDNIHIIGWILIGIAIFIIVASWVRVYIVNKSKFGAGLVGGVEGARMIKTLF